MLCIDGAELRVVTVREVEQAIDIPADEWPGNCYAIACAVVRTGLVFGRPAYGHWLGDVAPGTPFADRAEKLPFIPHGWVDQPFEMVTDPTRWVFEGVEPYIFWGKRGPEYDPGGNALLAAMMRPCPECDPGRPPVDLVFDDDITRVAVLDLLGYPTGITLDHVFWLANLPLGMLGDLAGPVFRAIVQAGHQAAIPIDNRELVLGDER
jgi:hypothetical protein